MPALCRDCQAWSAADARGECCPRCASRRETEFRPNRIDTGAHATGVLTCLVLEGGERRLLQTEARGPP